MVFLSDHLLCLKRSHNKYWFNLKGVQILSVTHKITRIFSKSKFIPTTIYFKLIYWQACLQCTLSSENYQTTFGVPGISFDRIKYSLIRLARSIQWRLYSSSFSNTMIFTYKKKKKNCFQNFNRSEGKAGYYPNEKFSSPSQISLKCDLCQEKKGMCCKKMVKTDHFLRILPRSFENVFPSSLLNSWCWRRHCNRFVVRISVTRNRNTRYVLKFFIYVGYILR